MAYMQMDISSYQKLSKESSDRALKFLDVEAEEIENCVMDSFEEPGNYQSDNKILREDSKW